MKKSYLSAGKLSSHKTGEWDARHQARHADQAVNASEADTDAPQPRGTDDPLAQCLVSRLKAEDGTRARREAVVDRLARVAGQPWVVDLEAELVQVSGDDMACCLLAVEAEREGLDAAEEEEGVEGREAVSDRVDGESDSLQS